MPTDEELVKIVWEHSGAPVPLADDAWEHAHQTYLRIARALRAALTPAVAPLAPGETVAIPDSVDPDGRLRLSDLEGLDGTHELRLDADVEDAGVTLSLDDAGVTLLEETCRRWRLSRERR